MFRACIASGSRIVASTTTPSTPRPALSSLFHTSSTLNASAASKRKGSRNRKLNIANTEKRHLAAQQTRPSVVLGTRPGEEDSKWKSSFLYQVLVKPEDLEPPTTTADATSVGGGGATQPTQLPIGLVDVPKNVAFGLDGEQKRMVLEDLPIVAAEMRTMEIDEEMKRNAEFALKAASKAGYDASGAAAAGFDMSMVSEPERLSMAGSKAEVLELNKAKLFAKALDLRNANAAGIAFENRRRIIMAFSTKENPFDTGRAEVQAALLTYKIRNLWEHLRTFRRDVGNRRGLTQLVHQRAKILRYLRKKDYGRYVTILDRLALEPESVEGELVV